jgi:nitrogen fixation/metabolism regulation signal transduction histidine kinase
MTHRAYQELAVSKLGLKRLYGLALTLTLALTLFATLAIAFILSERMTAPLRALARGTRAVARGDFSQVQASARKDELGMLTQSFNRMTQQLSDARETADLKAATSWPKPRIIWKASSAASAPPSSPSTRNCAFTSSIRRRRRFSASKARR